VAKRKFLLAIGQSNSTAIGDAQTWEDKHTLIRLRSPLATPPQFSEGSYSDRFTMPSTFPGGPQTSRFGDGPKRGTWQSFDCKGLAMQAVKMLTFYDPISSYFNLGSGYTLRYPGTCSALPGCTTDRLVSTVYWQYDPNGIKVTRKRTGIEHTIVVSAFTSLTNSVQVTPAMIPAPESGEEFTYELKLVTSASGKVRFANMFGGLSDLGMAGIPGFYDTTAKIGNALDASGTPSKGLIEYKLGPLNMGQPINVKKTKGLGDWDYNASPVVRPSTAIAIEWTNSNGVLMANGGTNAAPVAHGLKNGDKVMFGGTPPSNVTNVFKYVVDATPANFKISTTLGGAPLTYVDSGAGSQHAITGARIMHVTTTGFSVANKIRVRSYYVFDCASPSVSAIEEDDYQLETGQAIAFNKQSSGALPGNVSLNQTYYVTNLQQEVTGMIGSIAREQSFGLSTTPFGAAMTFSPAGTSPSALGDMQIVYAPETVYVNSKPQAESAVLLTTGPVFPPLLYQFTATAAHEMMNGERVRFSAQLPVPAPFDANTDYYVKRNNATIGENGVTFELAAYPDGPAIAHASQGAVCAIRRVDRAHIYEVAASPGGTAKPWAFSAAFSPINEAPYSYRDGEFTKKSSNDGMFQMRVLESFRGSMSGIQLRSISGNNNGQSVTCGDVTYELESGQYRSTVAYTGAFGNALLAGDKFVMEPPSVGGYSTPWQKWAYWLPWCPFEGRAWSSGSVSGSLAASAGGVVTWTGNIGVALAKNTAVKLQSQAQVYAPDIVAANGQVLFAGTAAAGSTTTSIVSATPSHTFIIGQQIRFTSGANNNEVRPVQQNTTGTAITTAFPNAVSPGDTFNVESLNTTTVFYTVTAHPVAGSNELLTGWKDKYLRFTSGALAGQVRFVEFQTSNTARVTPALSQAPAVGDDFEYIEQDLPPALVSGQTYYVASSTTTQLTFSATYDGTPLTSATAIPAQSVHVVIYDQEGKHNPMPPGFNYPNHYTPAPGTYQPYDGLKASPLQPLQGHYVGLGYKLYDYYGEPIHVAVLGVNATGITHNEVGASGTNLGTGSAWFDPDQQLSWAPGESNNCYARLMDVLDSAKAAFAAQGDTGECIGIVWVQGENDGSLLDATDRYADTCTTLKASIRQAIKDRGMFSSSPHKIPWVHPKIREASGWLYATELNQAIDKMVEADSYSRTFAVEDLTMMPDGAHYNGAGMYELANRAYDALLSIQRMGTSEVDICNLALANIGETAKVTSIDPPDGSAQASLCATFYPLARDSLLQMGYWSFAIKRKALTVVDNPRTEWQYAYAVPSDASGIIAVTPPDASNDYIEYGMDVPQKFVIETDINGKRILYTNQKDAHARYNAKIVDTTLFSTIFTIALSWHLASMLAGPIIKGDVGAAESKRCAQVASAYMMQAKTHDTTTQAEVKPPHTPSWINWR